MPVPQPIPNCAQVRLLFNNGHVNFMNVLHANVTAAGPLNPGVAETIFSAIKANASTTAWFSQLASTTNFTGVDVRDLRNANNPLLVSTSAQEPGTSAANPAAPQVAAVYTFRTAFAGRAFRGRIFLGGLASNCVDANGRFTGASQPLGENFLLAVQSILGANLGPMCIAQRFLPARNDVHGNPLPERPAGTVVISAIQLRDNILDTQRRRSGARIGSR